MHPDTVRVREIAQHVAGKQVNSSPHLHFNSLLVPSMPIPVHAQPFVALYAALQAITHTSISLNDAETIPTAYLQYTAAELNIFGKKTLCNYKLIDDNNKLSAFEY